jgi:hypothetical protein
MTNKYRRVGAQDRVARALRKSFGGISLPWWGAPSRGYVQLIWKVPLAMRMVLK